MQQQVWRDVASDRRFTGEFGTVPIDDEDEGEDLGGEILDSSCCLEGFRREPNCPCVGEFVGDVGRDPFNGWIEPLADSSVND